MRTLVNLEIMKHCLYLGGDVLELGVHNGNSAELMAPLCKEHDKHLILVDSFEGMPKSPVDTDNFHYREGRFSNASVSKVRKKVGPDPEIIQDWLPGVLVEERLAGPFCFVYLDLDHFYSTSVCLGLLWPIVTGGILCDDCNGCGILADAAVKQFIQAHECDWEETGNQQILLKKGVI